MSPDQPHIHALTCNPISVGLLVDTKCHFPGPNLHTKELFPEWVRDSPVQGHILLHAHGSLTCSQDNSFFLLLVKDKEETYTAKYTHYID